MEHNRKPDWKCGCWNIWLWVCDVCENQHIHKMCQSQSSAETSLELSRVRTNWTDLSAAGRPWEETMLVMTNATQPWVYNISICFHFISRDMFFLYSPMNDFGTIVLSCARYKWGVSEHGYMELTRSESMGVKENWQGQWSLNMLLVNFWSSTGCENIWPS